MSADSAARVVARAFLTRHAAPSDDPAVAAAALYRAYAVLSTNLRSAVGDDGTDTLMWRALLRVDERHPAARELRRTATSTIDSVQLATAVMTHGAPAIRAVIEELLATLIELLTRLVGEGLALRLIDHGSGVNVRPLPDEEKSHRWSGWVEH